MRAATWGTYGEIEGGPDCGICRRHDAGPLREDWGCDSPTTFAWYTVTCPRCHGEAPACERCSGTGFAPMYRCPSSQTTREIVGLLQDVSLYTEHGIMPSPGGRRQQTASFMRCVGVVGSERSRIMAKRMKEARSGDR